MAVFTFLWLLWIAAFFAVEGVAIFNKQPGDTFSEHVWRWFGIRDKGYAWRFRRFILLATLAWIVAHFLTGGQF